MELSQGYRSSRRNLSVLCALAYFWAAAQIEIDAAQSTGISIILTDPSMPFLFCVLLAFMTTRCTLEYTMQPAKIRAWRLAWFDYTVTLYLVRGTILVLAVSTAGRSITHTIYLFIAIVIALAFFYILGYLILIFLFKFFSTKKGKQEEQEERKKPAAIRKREGGFIHIPILIVVGIYMHILVIMLTVVAFSLSFLVTYLIMLALLFIPPINAFGQELAGIPASSAVAIAIAVLIVAASVVVVRWFENDLRASSQRKRLKSGARIVKTRLPKTTLKKRK